MHMKSILVRSSSVSAKTSDGIYIDLTAAYGHDLQDFLFRVLRQRTGALRLIAILQKMYEGTTVSI